MNVLVTGGSRGIGKAASIKLAQDGYHVIVNYHQNKEAAEETLEEVQKFSTGELLQFDIGDYEKSKEVLEQWQGAHPGEYIEVLVNNAGVQNDNSILWMKKEEWDRVLRTNLDSFFYLSKLLIEEMLKNKYGRIINVSSLSGIKGLPGQINYSASKAGLIGATKSLAQEVAKRKITVNAVAPGYIKTDMTSHLDEKELKKLIPIRRFGEPGEVAEVIAFLASQKASYITGEVISVNGGLYT